MPPIESISPPEVVSTPRVPHPAAPASPKPKKSRRGKWIAAAGLVAAVAIGASIYFRGSSKPQYTTFVADRADIESAITATGSTNAVVTVQVGSQVSGNIIGLYADFNTKVKKGQLVARIDPAIFQAKVDQAKATLDNAKAAVANARAGLVKMDSSIANAQANIANQQANVVKAQSAVTDAKLKNDRSIALVKAGIIAQQDADTAQSTYDQAVASLDAAKAQVTAALTALDSAKADKQAAATQIESAQAQVGQANATLQAAQLDLNHTQIYAPVDGTVVSRNMDVGQTVAASFQAPTIFQIAQDLTKMQVDTNVDESDVGQIRVGQTANFTVDAYPGVTFPGVVAQIRQAPINVQNVITYDVVVQVANPDLKLFPGMTANVRVVTGRSANALRVPAAALRFRAAKAPAGGGRGNAGKAGTRAQALYVLDHGQPRAVRVQFGLSDGNYIEVLSGLQEGQPVIVGGPPAASSGTPPSSRTGTKRIGI